MKIAKSLEARGVPFQYEPIKLSFVEPAKQRKYTPDLILPNNIIVELKGRFVTADRQKLKLVKEQHPHLDIRLVFANSKCRISKQSQTTYAMWCEKYGFPYADKDIPDEWLAEPAK